MDSRQPSAAILVFSLLWATSALVFAAAGWNWLAVGGCVLSAGAVAVELARTCRAVPETSPELLSRYIEQARAGRRLAIYDRDTGLFAHWYIALRGQEECARATRYARPLSLLIVEPHPSVAGEEWTTKGAIERWLQSGLRASDIVGYLGNSRFVILAPESDASHSDGLAERMTAEVGDIDVGRSVFPDDGAAFQDLWDTAMARIRGNKRNAARSATDQPGDVAGAA